MKIAKALLVFVVLIFTQCDKSVEPEVCPGAENKQWYTDLINQYTPKPEDSSVKPKVEIYSYWYQGQTAIGVFIIEPTCCDMMDVVYDCSGNVICEFGGIAGLNTCPDFESTATHKRLVFKN